MGYMFSTRSGTVYTVQETADPGVMMLTGGKFSGNEIYKPQGLIGEGQSFKAVFTNSYENQQMGVAGRTLSTSPIQSVHVLRSSQAEQGSRGAQAESRFSFDEPSNDSYQYD